MNQTEIAAKKLAEDFTYLDDWENRYQYLIDLGKGLAIFDDAEKKPENIVPGCASQVWLITQRKQDKLYFKASSDAFIVAGLLQLLTLLFNGQNSLEIAAFEIEQFFKQLKLDEALSPTRTNGFFSVVSKLKSQC